jgi:hypothetical protein
MVILSSSFEKRRNFKTPIYYNLRSNDNLENGKMYKIIVPSGTRSVFSV